MMSSTAESYFSYSVVEAIIFEKRYWPLLSQFDFLTTPSNPETESKKFWVTSRKQDKTETLRDYFFGHL